MYYQHFGLSEPPFSIAVNPRYLYMSDGHRDALAHLLYGVGSGGGFILLTGEVGTGKTTLNRCLVDQFPETTDIAIVLNPGLNAVELLACVCDELEIEYPRGSESLKLLTDSLHEFLLLNHQRKRRTVLMIDEAQHLVFEVLEQIRLLTNLETNEEKLLQIILIGQPELSVMLASPALRQLNQRITARFNLTPLNSQETRVYVKHRLRVAGLSDNVTIFSPSALRKIYKLTNGVPRLINLLCDRAMMGAYGRHLTIVPSKVVCQAASEVFGESNNRLIQRSRFISMSSPNLAISGERRPWWRLLILALLLFTFGVLLGSIVNGILSPTLIVDTASEPVKFGNDANYQNLEDYTQPQWMLGRKEAEQIYWALWSDAPSPPTMCSEVNNKAFICEVRFTETWDEIINLNRPVILDLRTSERFLASAVLLTMNSETAQLWTGSDICLAPIKDLVSLWLGGYRYLWRATDNWSGPIKQGDKGQNIKEVVELFARFDQLSPPPLETFTSDLEMRVTQFQRSAGLEADGVVGAKTLQRLNSKLGIGFNRDALSYRPKAMEESSSCL